MHHHGVIVAAGWMLNVNTARAEKKHKKLLFDLNRANERVAQTQSMRESAERTLRKMADWQETEVLLLPLCCCACTLRT